MATKLILDVAPNQGYGANQINTSVTLADLREALEEAILSYGEDAQVITYDTTNYRGASYGSLVLEYGELAFRDADAEDEE